MSEDPILRGNRWRLFYEEENGLRDMLDYIGQVYLKRMAAVDPWETDKLSNLSMAYKITQQVDNMVRAIVDNAKVEQAAKDHVDKIEKLPRAKRRFF